MTAEPVQFRPLTQPDLPDGRFLDREDSWLKFNERVLALAEDPTVPLLERVRFIAIFSSNLDEFFMVRVAGLRRRLATGLAVQMPSGRQPREELARINAITRTLMLRQTRCFREELLPALAVEGIEVCAGMSLSRPSSSTSMTYSAPGSTPCLRRWRSIRHTRSRTYLGSH